MVFGMASISEVEAIFLTAVVATIIALWGVITQRVVTRRGATLDFLSGMDTDNDLITARAEFNKAAKQPGGLAVLADAAQRDSDGAKAMRLVLNQNERIAIGIQFGILDREFVCRHGRGTLLRDWSLAAPFIYKLRQEYQNPALFHEFEDLARSLSDKPMPSRTAFWRLWF
jgi:hypothetical protein